MQPCTHHLDSSRICKIRRFRLSLQICSRQGKTKLELLQPVNRDKDSFVCFYMWFHLNPWLHLNPSSGFYWASVKRNLFAAHLTCQKQHRLGFRGIPKLNLLRVYVVVCAPCSAPRPYVGTQADTYITSCTVWMER